MTVLEPVNHATPDARQSGTHGYTNVIRKGGEKTDLTLWLDGRAEQGLSMARKRRRSAFPRTDTLRRQADGYPIPVGLLLSIPVSRARRTLSRKYVAVSRQNWGGDAQETLALAKAARNDGFDKLLSDHRAAWSELWKSDVIN